jgi:alpha-glucosidase
MTAPWWKGAVIYQVYVRSFFDSNGDGQGDLPGVLAKLDYIKSLGVDGVWLSPIHPSPNRDWGYDIADYEGVQYDYGTMADFEALLAGAHERGLKIILDEVLCHCSDEHPWFRESLDAASEKADWFVWADPKDDGNAPNNWLSVFGGPAWSYKPQRRKHYHHKFLRQQPKIDWRNDAAREACLKVLDFWLEKGVDGFRLDVANAYLHDATLADNPPIPAGERTARHWADAGAMQHRLHEANQPDNFTVLDEIRRRVEAHGDRFVFGEFSEEPARSGAYAAPDEGLHAGYTFNMLLARKRSPEFVARNIEDLAQYPRHWPCVSFSNHDVPRTATRFAAGSDPAAAAKLMFAVLACLKGTVLMYQGEELGLIDADLRRDQLRDPVGDLYYPDNKGRDGCRTPMPWSPGPNLGFSAGTPWLPAAPEPASVTVAAQENDLGSPLNAARAVLAVRAGSGALREGQIELVESPPDVLAFIRTQGEERIGCAFNLGAATTPFRFDGDLLLGQTVLTGLGFQIVRLD